MSEELTAIDPAELEADLAEVMAAGGEPHHKEMVAKFARLANQALLERDASRAREKALVEALKWYADPANWRAQGHPQIDADTIPAHRDRGIRARAVFILKPLDGSPSPADMPSDCHPQGE